MVRGSRSVGERFRSCDANSPPANRLAPCLINITSRGAMSCFAPRPTRLPDEARACLDRVVQRVGELYRGPATCLLVSEAGELRYEERARTDPHRWAPDVRGDRNRNPPRAPPRVDLAPPTRPLATRRYESDGGTGVDMRTLQNLCVLKRASLKLGEGADGRAVPAMHLRGDGRVVSCFDAGNAHVLVVTAEMHPTSAELFDARGAEAIMRDTLDELGRALL